MPALFVFLLKVNVALLIFCAGYYLVLRHLTFYTLNRIYLVTAILFATVYPEINLSGFVESHRQIAGPVINWQLPAKALIKPLEKPDYWHLTEIVFWAGVIILALRLLMQLYSLYKLYKNSTAAKIFDHDVRIMDSDAGPFSFWKSIYVNPAKHEPADLKSILLHEQVHVNEWHTLDILLAELSTIFYWFNPGVWLMKKAVRENIEFITDRKILDKGADAKQYQYSLVNVSFNAAPQGIVNHFNISTIKKRIIMMNAKRSSKFKLTRYAFLVPAVIVLLLVFTVSKAAFVKSSTKAIHRLTAEIKAKSIIKNEKPLSTFQPAIISKTINKKRQSADTNHLVTTTQSWATNKVKLSDTIIKADINEIHPTMYIVDGRIVKTYDISKIAPGSIATIDIGKSDNGREVVYINTKNGVDIKPITKIRLNGEDVKHLKGQVINGHIAFIDTVKEGSTVRVINGHMVLDTVIIGNQLTTTKFNSSFKYEPSSKLTFATSTFGSSFSVNHLSDKLIIINGRIATEADLKKLSAFDIDRMVLKTDEETKELYGDKAKNGIVFIVTKKR
jgi:bla regulator protein BlaR1